MAMVEKKLKLRLLVAKSSNKVVFAEVDEEFIDFVFYLLSLPMSTVIGLLKETEGGMIGSIGNVHLSLEKLDKHFFHDEEMRNALIKPGFPDLGFHVPALLTEDTNPPRRRGLTRAAWNLTDDLMVTPFFSSTHFDETVWASKTEEYEERVVYMGHDEALKLLRSAFQSDTVLTDVFLKEDEKSTSSDGGE